MKGQVPNEIFMKLAIEEQKKCESFPKVGAIIVKNGEIISSGYRGEIYGKHAERIAIEKVEKELLEDSTIFTTLEPCVEINPEQPEKSCTDLIIESGINEVVVGILDPNGKIYCQGQKRLLESNIKLHFFTAELRETIEAQTFKYGDCNVGYGEGGKRWVAVRGSGKKFEIKFSRKDERSIKFRWSQLQYSHGIVDLISSNNSVRSAIGVDKFDQISDPLVFRDPSHYSRMKVGDLAVIAPDDSSFLVIIKLLEMTETDIYFQWQVREK